jgi:hypothetical protein
MKLMNAADCGSIGALVISRFHQLSAGKSRRPLKSSFSVTAEVVTGGAGVGVEGGGVDGGVEPLGAGVGVDGVPLLHAEIRTAQMTANCRLNRRLKTETLNCRLSTADCLKCQW